MKKSRQTRNTERRDTKLDNRKGRLAVICLILAAVLVILGIRLFYINANYGEEYEKNIMDQQDYSSTTLAFRRGTITDRNNTVLATSERVYTLILDPKVILNNDGENLEATLEALRNVYQYDTEEIRTLINERSTSSYVRYQKELSEDQKEAFETYKTEHNNALEAGTTGNKVTGVWFEEEYKRTYPFSTLACSLLGFSGSDSSRGNWGIEEYYNSELVGINGREYGYITTDGVHERSVEAATDGNTVVSTIDYTVQLATENAIADYLVNNDAKNIGAIVMNPNNGEILAMATDKVYDLNDPSNLSYTYSEKEIAAMTEEEETEARSNMWKNYCVSDAYEPGSTAKPFTVAAALEENVVSETQEYSCPGSRTVADTTISCAHDHGTVTTTTSIVQSCNCAMMDMAKLLGTDTFTKYQAQFGLGKQTGIDLPGETSGLVYTSDMSDVDLATNSFGQSFTANMVQMASGLSSLVNGGYYYQPHVVKQILSSEGQVVKNIDKTLVRQTVTAETSEFIRNALFLTVEGGTGTTAQISGYSIGGKTGTAEKLPREEGKRLVSFVAAAPIDDPQVLIYVIVDEPEPLDGNISATIAIRIQRTILEQIIPYLGISASDYASINADDIVSAFTFKPEEEVAYKSISGTDPGLPTTNGDGEVVEETTSQYTSTNTNTNTTR